MIGNYFTLITEGEYEKAISSLYEISKELYESKGIIFFFKIKGQYIL